MVVLEERAGVAAGVLALGCAFVEDAALAAGRGPAAGAGIDRLACGVVEEEGDERVRQQPGHGVVVEWGAVGEGVAGLVDVDDDFGVDATTAAGGHGDERVGALLGE